MRADQGKDLNKKPEKEEMQRSDGYRTNIHSSIRKLILLFVESFEEMGKTYDPLDIENLASKVHQAMSAKYRKYHDLDHIFNVIDPSMPGFAKLAGIFHDVVYLNVDRRIHPLIAPYLSDFKIDENFECTLPRSESDSLLELVLAVFDFKPDQRLTPKNGLNEFLSAVVACRMLPEVFTSWELVQIIACIEATIPFRQHKNEDTPLDLLALRIPRIMSKRSFKPSQSEVDHVVTQAAKIAGHDLVGFYSLDLGFFLAETWDLILESNPVFRNPLYTVRQYRMALQKVLEFYQSLVPERIPPLFRNALNFDPQSQTDREWCAKVNIENGIAYLEEKLLTTSLLEAICELSGGDAPISLMLGESPDPQDQAPKAPIEFYLDYSIPEDNDGLRVYVHTVLALGRQKPSGFDFKHSPLATFLYERLRNKAKAEIHRRAKAMFNKEGSALAVLEAVPGPIMATLIDAVATISWTRRDALIKLKQKLNLKSSNNKVA